MGNIHGVCEQKDDYRYRVQRSRPIQVGAEYTLREIQNGTVWPFGSQIVCGYESPLTDKVVLRRIQMPI